MDGAVEHLVADFMIIGISTLTFDRFLRALVVEWRGETAYRIGCVWIHERDWVVNIKHKWRSVLLAVCNNFSQLG